MIFVGSASPYVQIVIDIREGIIEMINSSLIRCITTISASML